MLDLEQMPDIETGFAFRDEMYKQMGVPAHDPPAAKKVLFMLRGNRDERRKIVNLAELIKVVESYYNLTYTYVTPLPPALAAHHESE